MRNFQLPSVQIPQNRQPQGAIAWIAILCLALFTVLCILAGGAASKALNVIFPAGSLLVGVLLYRQYPNFYISFTWWIYFITPLVRRLADWKGGFTDPSPILLAPPLVAMVAMITFYRYLPTAARQGSLALALCCLSVIYSFLVGLINSSPVDAGIALLDWFAPLLFSFHLVTNWRSYPDYRQTLQTTFLWGSLLTGAYGIYQYMVAPEWDTFWLLQTGLFTSMGDPEPYGLRVWSTMNSPLHYATVAIAGTMILFTCRGKLRFLALGVSILSLLLTTVRTAWGGWLVALMTLLLLLKGSSHIRLVITLVVIGFCLVQLTALEPFASVIQSRFESFTNLEQDQSAEDRSAFYREYLGVALSEVLGKGIGSIGPIDSGAIALLLNLGWAGAIPYVGGIILIFSNLLRNSIGRADPFAATAIAISLSFVPMMIGSNVFVEISGVVFWSFLGLGMAAHKYHVHTVKP